ncbi:hypothetical protein NQZ68_004016 [Dissostichus eleginoides]|nr:hypothetical protein NQZ68_004016 [Dissostichus eleginoides]
MVVLSGAQRPAEKDLLDRGKEAEMQREGLIKTIANVAISTLTVLTLTAQASDWTSPPSRLHVKAVLEHEDLLIDGSRGEAVPSHYNLPIGGNM